MSDTALNSTFRQFAQMFLGRAHVDEEIPFVEALDRASLDGSIDTLPLVDEYLAHVQPHLASVSQRVCHNLALRCGAYVGECIRMTWPEMYDWTNYDSYVPQRPKMLATMPERTLETSAFLIRRPDAVLMPVGTVLRFLKEGPGKSVHAFAEAERQYHA